MKSDLFNKITALLKATDELDAEYAADPFAPEVIEAEGTITAAQAMIEQAASEPDSLSPGEIVALKKEGESILETAPITLRRAQTKRDNYYSLMHEKLNELKSDALPIIQATWQQFEERISSAVIELSGGYFSEHEKGMSVPIMIARHRSRDLRNYERTVDGRGYASATASEKLRQIRSALEACKQHLA